MNNKLLTLLFGIIASALILSACSGKTGNGTNEEQGQETENGSIQVDDEKVQASLLEFQDKVTSLINQYDDDFNQFAQTVENETENVNDEKLQALKDEAAQSSDELASKLRNIEVPKELETYSEDLNQSLAGLADQFKQRSKELNTDDVEQAFEKTKGASEEFYKQFESGLASIYDALGLETPSFLNETE